MADPTHVKCQHDSEMPIKEVEQLPDSQAGATRHRCAICARELGLRAGLKSAAERVFEQRVYLGLSGATTDAIMRIIYDE